MIYIKDINFRFGRVHILAVPLVGGGRFEKKIKKKERKVEKEKRGKKRRKKEKKEKKRKKIME